LPGSTRNACEAVIVLKWSSSESPSCDTQSAVLRKLLHQELEVSLFERDISNQVAYNLVFQINHFGVACIECARLACKMPLPALWHPDQFNPWVVGDVFAYDEVRAVRGAVADYDPFERTHRLSYH